MFKSPCAIAVAATALISSAAAAAQPRVLPGWPVVAGAGSVHIGPTNDTVVITEAGAGPVSTVASIRKSGVRRWLSSQRWGCGNCDDGGPGGLLPDGTYGPIGPEGDGAWGVGPDGRIVPTCLGAMRLDRLCVDHDTRFEFGSPPQGFVVARRGTEIVWQLPWPAGSGYWDEGLEAPPLVVMDAGGTVYTGVGFPPKMLAIDTYAGVQRWQVDGASPLVAMGSGVIARHPDLGLVRYNADGSIAWNVPASPLVDPRFRLLADSDRERVYGTSHGRPGTPTNVVALDARTGATLWKSADSARLRLLSIRSNGTLLAAVEQPAGRGLRAIGPDGRMRWQFDTASDVIGARAMPDGTVALTTAGIPWFRGSNGLAWRIDPRQPRANPRTVSITLPRRDVVFYTSCPDSACPEEYRANAGMVFHLKLPTRAKLRFRVLELNGVEVPSTRRETFAPAGTSAIRFGSVVLPPGRRVVEVRGVVSGRLVVRRFVVRVTRR